MSRKTHSRKRTHSKRSPKRKPSHVPLRKHNWRTKILAGAVAFVLLAGGTFAHWRAKRDEVLIAKNTPTPVKDVSTALARDLADIPPEALHPQPPIAAGYNAYRGGLPPGALPPGVVLPGMPMMQGGRTVAQGYGVYDGVRQQFTGKERDNETGLDYFRARYYSSTQGRFTGVDPENAGADPSDPQSWNGYAYARNNPLKYVDPDGLRYLVCDNAGNCQRHWDKEWKPLFDPNNASAAGITLKGNKDSGIILNAEGQQIGTYSFVDHDYWSDKQNGVVQALREPETWVNAIPGAILGATTRYRPTKPVNLPSARKVAVDMEEVRTGHMEGGLRAAQNAAETAAKRGKDLFPSWMNQKQVEQAIRDAYTHSEITQVQGARVKLRGVTQDGTVIEMWFNRSTRIIETAYPKGRASQ